MSTSELFKSEVQYCQCNVSKINVETVVKWTTLQMLRFTFLIGKSSYICNHLASQISHNKIAVISFCFLNSDELYSR